MAIYNNDKTEITLPGAGNISYEYDYFSGSNILVMFGDTLIDSAAHISFSKQQSKMPVYGYANQYYSFVAAGKIIVQGTLTIAFKESGYLLWPVQRFLERKASSKWTSPRYAVEGEKIIQGYEPGEGELSFASAAEAAKRRKVMRANVEQMAAWSQENNLDLTSNTDYNKFWLGLGALPDNEFEDWAETFEDAIWYGSDNNNPILRNRLFAKNLKENQELDNETVLSHRTLDLYPAIDIHIIYGDMSEGSPNHSVKQLLDVSFTGSAQTIEVSGEPIYEQYSFIARNLV